MTLLAWLAQWEWAWLVVEQYDDSPQVPPGHVAITIYIGIRGEVSAREQMVCPVEEVGTWVKVMVGRLGIAALLEDY